MFYYSLQLGKTVLTNLIFSGIYTSDKGEEILRIDLGASISQYQICDPKKVFSGNEIISVIQTGPSSTVVKDSYKGYTELVSINTKIQQSSSSPIITTVLLKKHHIKSPIITTC